MEQSMLITVVPDAVIEAEQNETDTDKIIKVVKKAATTVAMGYFGLGVALVQTISAVLDARKRALAENLNVAMVGTQQAKGLIFPPGHPRAQVVYMQHPANPLTYYPLASFHRHVFEHKFREALLLLGGLGATTIDVQHVRGWSRAFAASMSTPIPASAGNEQVEASVGAKAQLDDKLLFRAALDGSGAPALISDAVWYPHEPMWQALATLRLEHGLREFSLSLAYEEDYQVNAKLAAALEGVNFQVGGKFEDHVSTVWTMSGQFTAQQPV